MQHNQLAFIVNRAIPYEQGGTATGAFLIAGFIAQLLTATFIIAGVALIFVILWSAIQWLTSGDNADSLKAAQKRLTGALIGFSILASAFAIVKLVGYFFNIEFLQSLIFNWPSLFP